MTETEAAFLELYDKYYNMVYRLALSCTKSRPDAEDVVQTVFLKLVDTRHPPAPGKEKAWLAQVAVNASRDVLRSFWRQRAEPLDESIPFDRPEEGELFSAVMALPAKYRAAVHLHYYEGYTLEEIAGILHISPSAVSMRLHRARKLLWNSLKEDGYGPAVSKNL